MNRDKFQEEVIKPTFQSILELNNTKGDDYAGSEFALANFYRNAERLGLSPQQVLMVYLNKHMDAIETYARNGKLKSEPIEGRIDDAILYLLLLKAIVVYEEHRAKMDGVYDAIHRDLDEAGARRAEQVVAERGLDGTPS